MVSAYIAWYLFLAGAGGGAFLLGSTVDLTLRFFPNACRGWFSRVSVVTDAGLVLGPALVLASAVFLVLDLGVPDRALRLFAASTPSLLSLGAWAILLFCTTALAALVLGFLAGDETDPETSGLRVVLRVVEFACSLIATGLALFVVGYAGAFLASYPSLPFLHTLWVPALFVASALATGLGALIVVALFRQAASGMVDGVGALLPLDALLVAVELAALIGLVASSLLRGDAPEAAALQLLTGPLAAAFWGGVVVLGLIVPLSVDFICRSSCRLMPAAVGAACTLIGGIALRFVLLMATQRFNLVFMSALVFWQ